MHKAKKQNEKKRIIGGLFFCILTGLIMTTVGIGAFLYIRPFEKFVYVRCETLNKDFFYPDNTHVTVIFYVDEVKYEHTFDRGKQLTGVSFYYNENNPTDVMPVSRENLIVLFPCVAGIGLVVIAIGAVNYIHRKNKKAK